VGRPPQAVGVYGRIHFVEQPSGETQARTRFRDYGGRIRMVTKVGRSRAAAKRSLKTELTNRQALGGGSAITGSTRVTALADVWMEAEHGWSNGTTEEELAARLAEPCVPISDISTFMSPDDYR
jgi:hypothetical protein